MIERNRHRRCPGDILRGIASIAVLYYVLFSDIYRFPEQWQSAVPRDVFCSPAAFLICIGALFFAEGASRRWREAGSPVRAAIRCYIPYWKVCLPLTAVGYALFNGAHGLPIYSPMFEKPTFLNIARALVALTNNVHEGAWLVSCLALCAFFAALGDRLSERRGAAWRWAALAGGVAASAILYLVVMPFHYHKAVFRVGAVFGSACFMLGATLGDLPAVRALFRDEKDHAAGKRALNAVLSPLRYIGREWVAFWLVQFFVGWYFNNIPASVYTAFGPGLAAFAVMLVLCVAMLYAIEWGYERLLTAWKHSKIATVAALVLLLATPFLLQFALETSVIYGGYAKRAAQQWPYYTLINVAAILCVMLLLRSISGHWHTSGIVATVLFTALAVANYYTMKFHGTLLMAEDLRNIGTATNVIKGYNLAIDAVSGKVLLLGAGALACCVLTGLAARALKPALSKGRRWPGSVICLLLAVGVGYLLYFAPKPVLNKNKNTWNWLVTYSDIGYLSGTVESTIANSGSVIERPEYYSDERIAQLVGEAGERKDAPVAATAAYPDIIMILNETYYDLARYIDLDADVDYMARYDALDNAVKGYVMTPFAGGNTNSSEYEMLTGNSMTLVSTNSPFNRFDFSDQICLPKYLQQLGYATIATHPHDAQNYLRGLRWGQMGFDETYFLEVYTDLECYGNRGRRSMGRATDASAFKNLVRFYSDMPEDRPRFAFMITIQNHGGWDQNTPEQALVHCKLDTGDAAMVKMIDEFTSCISLTDEAIGQLQDYFTELYEETGRRVVVCMAGDHSPSFISDLGDLCKWEDEAVARRMARSTPYFIWANYPLEGKDLAGTDEMDLTSLAPTMLDVAGVPLSYYFRSCLDVRREIQAFTYVESNYRDEDHQARFCDRSGAIHDLEENTPQAALLRDYYTMEYNLFGRGVERESVLFEP